MKNTLMIAVACLLTGGAVGYLAGNNSEEVSKEVEREASLRIGDRDRSATSRDKSSASNTRSYEDIAALPGQTARIQSLIELYSDLDPSQFAVEAEKLDELPFSERILAAYLLFAAWAEVSPYDAMAHANTKMGFAGNFVKPTVLQSWAASDPAGAASYYESNKREFAMMGMMGRGPGGGQSGAGVVAAEWAKQDPDSALTWAKSLEGRDAGQAVSGVLTELAKTDPAKAASMINEVDEAGRSRAYASIAGEWAKKDWAATESWLATLPADERDRATGSALKSLASTNTSLAAQKTLSLPEGDARSDAMENVAREMAKESPTDAMGWVMKNGNEDAQRKAVGDVIREWASTDSKAAVTWINEQEGGPVRDEAVQSYVFSNQTGSARESVILAETISDDRTRDRTLGMSAFQWMNEDKDAAQSYIESTDALSEGAKERILNGGGRGPGPGR
ncbi:MAG: hypothetical protein ACSHYF_00665 [Verrucomicrobiaceae bacterium]